MRSIADLMRPRKGSPPTRGLKPPASTHLHLQGTPAPVEGSHARKVAWTIGRDGTDCCWCHKPLDHDYTLEHLHRRAEGGPCAPENWAAAHARCNNERHH